MAQKLKLTLSVDGTPFHVEEDVALPTELDSALAIAEKLFQATGQPFPTVTAQAEFVEA